MTVFEGVLLSVYLHPAPTSSVPAHLDAPHASFALARHLGLESFEKIGEGDGIWLGEVEADSEALIGSAPRDSLLVSMSEDDARASSTPQLEASQFVNIFSAPTEANRAFLASAAGLVDFLDRQSSSSTEEPGYDSFGAFELSGLKELAEQYGTSSEAYKTAVATLQAVLISALSRDDLHLAVVTFSPESQLSKRDDDPSQAPLPPILHPAEPIGSACFTTEEACSNATDLCSGHGECVGATKAGKTCYVCACSASLDEKGRKEEWAGQACERKDISGRVTLPPGIKQLD
ncbi:hypothetical protein EIP86_008793 [Pleurotus ostreatoroseus]|nr:hypothetical protein EIP86_008793 [Pleurotus ostreatoroseus]